MIRADRRRAENLAAKQREVTFRFLESIGVQPLVDTDTGEAIVDVRAVAARLGMSEAEMWETLGKAGVTEEATRPRNVGRVQ